MAPMLKVPARNLCRARRLRRQLSATAQMRSPLRKLPRRVDTATLPAPVVKDRQATTQPMGPLGAIKWPLPMDQRRTARKPRRSTALNRQHLQRSLPVKRPWQVGMRVVRARRQMQHHRRRRVRLARILRTVEHIMMATREFQHRPSSLLEGLSRQTSAMGRSVVTPLQCSQLLASLPGTACPCESHRCKPAMGT